MRQTGSGVICRTDPEVNIPEGAHASLEYVASLEESFLGSFLLY